MRKTIKKSLISVLSLAMLSFVGAGAVWINNVSTKADEIPLESWQTDVVSNVYGASCRIVSANDSGLRFKAEINREKYEALAETSQVSVGIIIVPTEYITNAGGYTHEKLLAAYDKETGTIAKTGIIDKSYTEEEIGDYEVYAASIIEILDDNYTRAFSGISYICVDGEYSYAPYCKYANSRSVYDVANKAYNDRDEEGGSKYSDEKLVYIGAFMDGVLDIQEKDGKLVNNNTEYYTSPFVFEEDGKGNYAVDTKGNTVKATLFNNEKIATAGFTTESGIRVGFTKSKGMTVNEDGTVTLKGYAAGTAGWKSGVSAVIGSVNSFLAFEGDYGTGTYMQFTYTGNNMPQLCLFANSINSDITCGGSQENAGIIMLNGFTCTTASGENYKQYYGIWGPTRYYGTNNINQNTEYRILRSAHPELTQAGLEKEQWANVNFRYLVGTYTDSNGYIVMDIQLYNADTNEAYYKEEITTTWLASQYGNGHIIAYAGVKGNDSTTTFGYSIPDSKNIINTDFKITQKTITKNAGARVALNGTTFGYSESDVWDVAFEVTKTKAIGTEKEVLKNITAFTVESGYFYDVNITAISEFGTTKKYARICAADISDYLYGFENGTYTIPTIGSAVTCWSDAIDEYGNDYVKMYKTGTYKVGAHANQPLVVTQLLEYSGLSADTTAKYKLYADVSYLKMEDGNANWAVQLNASTYVTKQAGRYYVGEISWASNRWQLLLSATRGLDNEYGIDGTNNYAVWDNLVLFNSATEIPDFGVTAQYQEKAPGEVVTLSSDTFGYELGGVWDVSFEVTKSKAMGTEKVLLENITEFTVEAGYFYDINITATSAFETVKNYARVCANDVNLYGFEEGSYTIPTIGSAVTCWSDAEDEFGNKYVKMYKTGMYKLTTNANQPVNVTSLLTAAGLASDTSATYKMYADVSYLKLDNDQSWAVQFTSGTGYATKLAGRYYVGEVTWNASAGRFQTAILTRGLDTDYGVDGAKNYCIWDNIVLVRTDLNLSSYEDKSFDAYAYGAPGVEATTAAEVTAQKMEIYAGVGFNRYLLFGNMANNWDSTIWANNKLIAQEAIKKAMDEGIKQFIIRDTGLEALTTAAWDTKTDDQLIAQIKVYLNRYATWKNDDGSYTITGVDFGDEPVGRRIAQYARVYKLVKQVAASTDFNRSDLEIYTCLLPAYGVDTSKFAIDGEMVGEEDRFTTYRTYISTFLTLSGADNFVVDVYPFVAKYSQTKKYFKEGYYATLQIVAQEAKNVGAEYGFVAQSMGETKEWRLIDAAEMKLQVNSIIGFGGKEIGFYRYAPNVGLDVAIPNAYMVGADGTTKYTAYTYAMNELATAESIADIILSFDYNASALYGDSTTSYYENYTVGFTNDAFQYAEVTAHGSMTLATELFDEERGMYGYMFQNVLDTVYGAETSTISVKFAGYSKVAVISEGVISYVTLTNGEYTTTLANGAAVYVIPVC